VPLAVLPSSIWRVVTVHPDAGRGGVPEWLPMHAYVIVLSILSELVAFTAVGLVAGWGERFPRWVPGLGARRIPTAVASIPAALGAFVLTLMWGVALVCEVRDVTLQGEPTPASFPSKAGGWEAAYFYVSYAPLLLWGPLLAAVTVAYVRRRRG
jgi:hypothetical protein